MDEMAIADRRHLRRKVMFWRVAAILLLAASCFAFWRLAFPSTRALAQPHIARVEIRGLIADNRELLDSLEAIATSNEVKGLIVSISSTGGTTYGGERIYKAIRKVAEKKPVVADIRTVAASAGYMVAIAADRIVAGDTSLTGSIGTIFNYAQFGPLLDKLGVAVKDIKSAPLKAEPSPFHEESEEARAMIRNMVMDSYDWFVDLVVERRKLDRAEVLRLADGSIYTGRQALKARLIDTVGGNDDILDWLKSRNVDPALPVIEWKTPTGMSLFSLTGLARLFDAAGYGHLLPLGSAAGAGAEKLFLDGLVSVWQFDPA